MAHSRNCPRELVLKFPPPMRREALAVTAGGVEEGNPGRGGKGGKEGQGQPGHLEHGSWASLTSHLRYTVLTWGLPHVSHTRPMPRERGEVRHVLYSYV